MVICNLFNFIIFMSKKTTASQAEELAKIEKEVDKIREDRDLELNKIRKQIEARQIQAVLDSLK